MCIYNYNVYDLRGYHQVGFYSGYKNGTSLFKIPINTFRDYYQVFE